MEWNKIEGALAKICGPKCQSLWKMYQMGLGFQDLNPKPKQLKQQVECLEEEREREHVGN
jgi:hypothetical protein